MIYIKAKSTQSLRTCQLEISLSSYPVGRSVILSKEYDKNSSMNIPWLIFSPFPENIIEWTSTFGIYAANVSKDNVFMMLTSRSADMGKSYLFQHNRFGEVQDGRSKKITIVNQVDQTLFFGLTQDVIVNNESFVNKPISIACVPYNQTAEFFPLELLTLFCGSGYQEKRFMGVQVHGQMLTLDFTETTHLRIGYDEKMARFIKY